MLEIVKSDVWKEGTIREVFKNQENGIPLRTGYELFFKHPTIMIALNPREQTRFCKNGWLAGIELTNYSVKKTIYDYRPFIGDIETGFKIEVTRDRCPGMIETEYSDDSKPIDNDIKLIFTDLPLTKREDLIRYEMSYFSSKSSWFPLLEDYGSSKEFKSNLPVSDCAFASEDLHKDFRRIMIKHVSNRRKTNSLPSQIRERTNKFIKDMPYEKKPQQMDITNDFAEWKGR